MSLLLTVQDIYEQTLLPLTSEKAFGAKGEDELQYRRSSSLSHPCRALSLERSFEVGPS